MTSALSNLAKANAWRHNIEERLPGAGGGRQGELLFKRYGASVGEEKVLEMPSVRGHTTLRMYLMSLSRVYKNR